MIIFIKYTFSRNAIDIMLGWSTNIFLYKIYFFHPAPNR